LKSTHSGAIPALITEALGILQGDEVGVHFEALAQSYNATTIGEVIGETSRAPTLLVNLLTELLDHPTWEVRCQAAQAVGEVRRGVPDAALRRLLRLRRDDPSRAVRQAVDDALACVLSLEAGIEDDE
jgi:HEAT repeat protein